MKDSGIGCQADFDEEMGDSSGFNVTYDKGNKNSALRKDTEIEPVYGEVDLSYFQGDFSNKRTKLDSLLVDGRPSPGHITENS
jgi:hypothetical protein